MLFLVHSLSGKQIGNKLIMHTSYMYKTEWSALIQVALEPQYKSLFFILSLLYKLLISF